MSPARPFITPVILEGPCFARLEPLAAEHTEALMAAVRDGELWNLWFTFIPTPQEMAGQVSTLLRQREREGIMPFVVRRRDDGRVVGMTRYMNVQAEHRRLEIGGTWYAASEQRSGLNTECKALLLQHAFEQLDCIAVEFRTHVLNQRSRRAIERLGARLDGVLRHHMIMPNGTVRDTAVYSITSADWPAVKAHLQALQQR
jgi:RimJ/RimL family protein N-acetyltransferase